MAPARILTDLSLAEFESLVELPGARSYFPKSIRRWTFERGARSVDQMTDLPLSFREQLGQHFQVRGSQVALKQDSDDGTTKLLLTLHDGQSIEAVIIPEGERSTLCVSTQVGCGVRCAFCASGMNGLSRNLSAGEIVEQFLYARELLSEREAQLTNLVLMGGGEPLNNFEAVKTALETLNDPAGIGFGARRITLSTIGIPKRIDRLEELGRQINLAISLHAPNEELRGQLIPGLDRVPLADVLAAASRYFERTGREITFEYVLLKNVNDSHECANQLAQLLKGVRCNVNLIPLNPVDEIPFQRPEDEAVERMARALEQAGIRTTVRRSRGRDIDAACGQLRRRVLREE